MRPTEAGEHDHIGVGHYSDWDGADFRNESQKPASKDTIPIGMEQISPMKTKNLQDITVNAEGMSTSRTIVLASKFYIHTSM